MAKCEFYTLVTTGFTLSLAHILLSSANAMSAVEEGGVRRGGGLLPRGTEGKGGLLGKKKTLALVEEASDRVRLVEHKLLTSETKRLVIFCVT